MLFQDESARSIVLINPSLFKERHNPGADGRGGGTVERATLLADGRDLCNVSVCNQ